MTQDEDPRPRPRQAARARAALIEAGLSVLRQDGLESFAIRSVADAAGCSIMGIYRHLGSLEGLEYAVGDAGLARLKTVVASVPGTGTLADDALSLARTYLGFVRRNRGLFGLWQQRSAARCVPVELELVRWWADADRSGSFRANGLAEASLPEVEVEAFLRGAATLLHGYAALELAGVLGEEDFERVVAPGLTTLTSRLMSIAVQSVVLGGRRPAIAG